MYTIKKVSELVGIPTVTIRAWENRYHIITPQRSDGGHRLYSQTDIDKLKWLKEQLETRGLKIGEAARLLNDNAKSLPALTPFEHISVPNYKEDKERLYHALVNLNANQANQIIDMAFSLYSYEDVFHKVLTPVLHLIGTEWESGKITVAQEHFSTELIMQRVTHFFRILPTNPQLPKVVAFCPEGESHQMGLLLFSLFLKKRGLDVMYLGANTPYEGLIDLIKLKNISAVAASLTHSKHVKPLMKWIQKCQHENLDLAFILGGKGHKDIKEPPSKTTILDNHLDWDDWYYSFLLSRSSNPDHKQS